MDKKAQGVLVVFCAMALMLLLLRGGRQYWPLVGAGVVGMAAVAAMAPGSGSASRGGARGGARGLDCVARLRQLADARPFDPLEFGHALGRAQEIVDGAYTRENVSGYWWKPVEPLVQQRDWLMLQTQIDTLRARAAAADPSRERVEPDPAQIVHCVSQLRRFALRASERQGFNALQFGFNAGRLQEMLGGAADWWPEVSAAVRAARAAPAAASAPASAWDATLAAVERLRERAGVAYDEATVSKGRVAELD